MKTDKEIVETLYKSLYVELNDSYESLLALKDGRDIKQQRLSQEDTEKADDLYLDIINTECTDEYEAGRISVLKYII